MLKMYIFVVSFSINVENVCSLHFRPIHNIENVYVPFIPNIFQKVTKILVITSTCEKFEFFHKILSLLSRKFVYFSVFHKLNRYARKVSRNISGNFEKYQRNFWELFWNIFFYFGKFRGLFRRILRFIP